MKRAAKKVCGGGRAWGWGHDLGFGALGLCVGFRAFGFRHLGFAAMGLLRLF